MAMIEMIPLSIKKIISPQNDIEQVLSQDPRSVYLRTKHGSQLFTFRISNAMVSCQFDDENSTVTVVQVLKAEQFDAEICNDLNG